MADIFGDIAEFWGFTRTQGRIFGFIFMCSEPVDQGTVRRSLKISAGSASMTLHSLVEWGVLHREDRLYVAETNFFALITNVMKHRERERVEAAITAVREVGRVLLALPSDDPNVAFARGRVQHLLSFCEAGLDFLDAFVDRSPVRALLNGLARKASRLRPANFTHRVSPTEADRENDAIPQNRRQAASNLPSAIPRDLRSDS